MQPLSHFSCTSSVRVLVKHQLQHSKLQFLPGINEKKQMSYKILTGLIMVMFALQTIHNIGTWYITWLGFIDYSDAPDQALDTLELDGTRLSLRVVGSMLFLLTILRLAIADSIMVSTGWQLPANTINSI
jgi:hypothetical protein